jgi:hypothetical protein
MERMNKICMWIINFTAVAIMSSCFIQSKYGLEGVIGKNATEVVGKNAYYVMKREVVTHQPAYGVTQDLVKYKFGNIKFTDDSGNSYVQFLMNSLDEKIIIGMKINIKNNASECKKMKQYLDEIYGEPEVIVPEPTEKIEGVILGNSTYVWIDKQNNSSIYFYANYYEHDYEQAIGYSVEIIQNDAVSIENPDNKIIDEYMTRF